MDKARWQKVEVIFDEAMDVPADRREAWVAERCGDDADLLADVIRLLHAAADSEGFLESDSPDHLHKVLQGMAKDIEEGDMPRAVGPYRLIRPLGRGGMGQVYLAVRDDEAFRRYVAVKVIKRGMDSDEILKRFRMERQILASLTHPNIARLLDGGATDEGLSYFVMEFVDGERIDTYCDEHRLSLDERLVIFGKVCSAVHYAHQNLIVHRDLKPSNILVTSQGEVKLLDFGIAKFLNPDLAGYTLPMTRKEDRVLTPEYASPEQLRGGSITTSSDVYQLGVLLYELLTGHKPFVFQTTARREIEQMVLEKEPERPSTMVTRSGTESASRLRATSLDRLRRQLSGDLDRIVLMALRKEQDRRYESASELLQDIENYRQGRPVKAQSDSPLYRTGKFVRRNRIVVGFSTVVLLLLVTTTVISVRNARSMAEQKAQTELEARKAERVTAYIVDLFEAAAPERLQGRDMTVRELVQEGARTLERGEGVEPDLAAALRNTVGAVLTEIGDMERATVLLEENIRLLKARLGPEKDHSDLANALYRLGYVLDEGSTRSSWERAEALYEEALAMTRRLQGYPSREAAQIVNDLAVTHMRLEEDSTARVLLDEALSERRLLFPDGHHKDIAETLSNLGTWSARNGDFPAAERYYRESLSMSRSTLGEDHPLVADNIYNLGSILYDLGLYEEAQGLLQDAAERRQAIYGAQHDETARAHSYLGRTLLAQGNVGEAERHFMRAYEVHQAVHGDISFFTAMDLMWLGRLEREKGRLDVAADWYTKAVDVFGRAGAEDWAAMFQGELATVLADGGQTTRALTAYRRAVQIMSDAWGNADTDLAATRHEYAKLLIETDRLDEAETELEQSLDAFLGADMVDAAADVRLTLARLESARSRS